MDDGDRWLYGWGLGYAAVGAASLLVPLYALERGGDAMLVGVLAATAALAGVPGALLWGRLVARTERRRPFVVVALLLTGGVLAVLPFLAAPVALVVVNAALWFAVSAAAPVLNLIVVEGRPESAWSERIGLLNAAQGYGWVAGLLVGTGWTALASDFLPMLAAQRALFGALAALTGLAVALVVRWYPERSTLSEERFRRVYRRLGRGRWGAGRYLRVGGYGPSRLYWGIRTVDPVRVRRSLSGAFGRYLAAMTLCAVGFSVFWGPMPAYLDVTGLTTGAIFGLFVLANAASAVCYVPVGRLAGRKSPRSLQAGALVARGVAFPFAGAVGATAFRLPAIALVFLVSGVSWAVIAVTATDLVSRLVPADQRGGALGLYAAIAGVGGGTGSALGGVLAGTVGYSLTFALAGAFVLAGTAVVAFGAAASAPTGHPDI